MDPSASERNPVEKLAEEFAERQRRGEHPALTEYTDRYPQWADEIRELFPALVLMEQFKPRPGDATGPEGAATRAASQPLEHLGDYRILREIGRGGMGIVYEAEQVSLGRHVALKVLPAQQRLDSCQLGRFQREAKAAARLHHTNIVPVYGVGEANGLHYYVMQFIQGQGLDQVLKELRRLRPAQPGSPAKTENDLRLRDRTQSLEVSAVAQALLTGHFQKNAEREMMNDEQEELRKGSGNRVEQPFPAARSSFIIHHSSLSSDSGRPYWQSVARVGIQVAEALAYAHAQGTLHRDIKPSNLLVDTQGIVWVTDFGLAKATEDRDNLTHTGDLVGTLRYMAPERFEGQADARSDLYALGLTLYELLTFRPAFDEAERHKLAAQVMHTEPPRPRKLNPLVPRDLETIVLKALAHEPARRYQTAGELAEELKRFVEDRPIRARPVGWAEQIWRWCRRTPLVAALATAVALLTLVGLAGVTWQWREARASAEAATQNAAEAREAEDRANRNARDAWEAREHLAARARDLEWQNYRHSVALAHHEWLASNVARAKQLLEQCPPALRGWEWRYCQRLCHLDLLSFGEHKGWVLGLAYSPDGQRIATASVDHTLKLWDAGSGREIFTVPSNIPANPQSGQALAFSPDGSRIAVNCPDGVALFSAETGQQLLKLPTRGRPHSVAFSPDGKRLASAGWDGPVQVWDATRSGPELLALRGHTSGVINVAFSADGGRIVSAGWDSTVRMCDAATGKEIRVFRGHQGGVYAVAFSPDGTRIASGSWDNNVKLWDAATGQEVLTLRGHTGFIRSVAFRPDGKQLASGGEDNAIKLWDVTNGRELFTLRGHTGFVVVVAFRPDGRHLASASHDGTVKVWDVANDPQVLTFSGHTGWVRCLAFSPDGQRIASGSGWPGPALKVWETDTGRMTAELRGHTANVNSIAFSSDGRHLVSGSEDGTVILWDAAKNIQTHTLRRSGGCVNSVAFSPDGGRVASASNDRAVRVWDTTTGREILNFRNHTGSVYSVAFSPDGKLAASAGQDGAVRIWEARSGQEIRTLKRSMYPSGTNHTWCQILTFSPDGRWVAAAGGSDNLGALNNLGDVKVWDVASSREVFTLRGHTGAINCVAFSSDGTRLASGSNDGTLKLWNTATGEEVFTLRGHKSGVLCVAFSPQGEKIASGSIDFTVRVLHAPMGLEAFTPEGHSDGVPSDEVGEDHESSRESSSDSLRRRSKVAESPDHPSRP